MQLSVRYEELDVKKMLFPARRGKGCPNGDLAIITSVVVVKVPEWLTGGVGKIRRDLAIDVL